MKSTGLNDDPGNMQQLNTSLQLPLEDAQHYGQETMESLSPLSKHIMEHEEELKLLKKKKRQSNPKQYQQNSSQIVATSYKSRHAQRQTFIPAQPDHHSPRNNTKSTYLKRGSGAKASPRLARTQRQHTGTRKNQSKKTGGTIIHGNKPLPSYMRSTAATRLWKSSTEAEKKKPKHLRTEIY